MLKKKLDGLDYILRLCSLYILIWTISPPLQHPMLFRILVLAAGLLWVLLSWLKISGGNTNVQVVYLSVCIFCILAIFIEWIAGSGIIDAVISQLQIIIFLLFILQFIYYKNYDTEYIKILTIVALLLLTIFQVRTLIEYQTNPGVSRLLVRSSEDAKSYAAKGVGGYGLVYPSIFSNTALMYLLGKVKGPKKIPVLISLIIGVLLVMSSGFLIAAIMTLVSIFAWIIKMFNTKNVMDVLLSILLLIVIVFTAMDLLLEYSDSVIEAMDGTFYKQKVKEIIHALKTDQTTGKLEGRTSRYLESIKGIFRFPIIGAKVLGYESELGGHSTLLDMLGLLGIFSIGFYYVLYFALKSMYKLIKHKGFIITVVMLLLLNGTLNTIVGSHGIIFIVVPGVVLLSKTEN